MRVLALNQRIREGRGDDVHGRRKEGWVVRNQRSDIIRRIVVENLINREE